MSITFEAVLIFFVFMINTSYGQSFECDNNFGDCGTPNQSGGGGGGGGSILIANTDLGDTYQNADDYDDDGIEDSSDNCLRIPNVDQTDRDGDGFGDACDNCMSYWNQDQLNTDGDDFGDVCDYDDDNDGVEDVQDRCPLHWGEESCINFEEFAGDNQYNEDIDYNGDNISSQRNSDMSINLSDQEITDLNSSDCNAVHSNNTSVFLLLTILFFRLYNKTRYGKI